MSLRKKRHSRAPRGVRPTPAKVREALFSIVRDRVEGASFVELYAGSGVVGSEALERGATRVLWVERDPSFLRKRLETEGAGTGATGKIIGTDVIRFLRDNRELFDLAYADPPYFTGEVDRLLSFLADRPLLREGGILVVEHAKRVELPESAGQLCRLKSYRYGDTRLTLFEMQGQSSDRDSDRVKEDNSNA